MLLTTASASTQALLDWLSEGRLAPWAVVIEADLADPGKVTHLQTQLDDASRWRGYVASTRRPVVQLVDVLPADEGWQSAPLTDVDALVLEDYLRRQTGVKFTVTLLTETVRYVDEFAGKFRELPMGRVVTTSGYTSTAVDPDVPILYTFGVREDDEGRRVVASAAGERPDDRAMVGSAARPISASNTWLYTHELLHALGIRHHLRHDVYSDPGNPVLVEAAIVGSDCIMTASYVGGVWDGDPETVADARAKRAMLDAVCPLCRYLLGSKPQRRYVRWYLERALWM